VLTVGTILKYTAGNETVVARSIPEVMERG